MKKKGSAILVVVGSVSVLCILAFTFISSSQSRNSISKLASNDKKAEALAESATDYIIKSLRKNINNHDSSEADGNKFLKDIYYLLRVPLKAKGDGDNFQLNISDINPVNEIENIIDFNSVIDTTKKEIGWEEAKVTSSCKIVNAEYFTPYDSDYKVTTMNWPHLTADGDSAKFLDDIDDSKNGQENITDMTSSDWKLRFIFPNAEPLNEYIKLETRGIHVDVSLNVSRIEDTENGIPKQYSTYLSIYGKAVLKIKLLFCTIKIPFTIDKKINIQKELDDCEFFPDIKPKSLQGLKNAFTKGDPAYDFSQYVSNIKTRKNTLLTEYQKSLPGFTMDEDIKEDPYYLEKGSVLQIKTTVSYPAKNIEKTLITEIPFKVSDVQPIAPEYSFFIANTTFVSSQDDIVQEEGTAIDTTHTLGNPIEINKNLSAFTTNNGSPPAGTFIVHNCPVELSSDRKKDIIDYSGFDDGKRVPGMVRINTNYEPGSSDVTKVKCFLGIKDQPYLNELNKLFNPFDESWSRNKFNTRVSFLWENLDYGNSIEHKYHELEFPLLFEKNKYKEYPNYVGLENIMKLFKQGDYAILSVPTLLFGNNHMEYPLGLRAEGPINSEFSRFRLYVHVQVRARVSFSNPVRDETTIHFDYSPVTTYNNSASLYDFENNPGANMNNGYEPATYGMQDYKGYNPNSAWDSEEDCKYCPANCYDALQYAKKATKYYKTGSEFIKALKTTVDKGGLKESSTSNKIILNGVYYIKDGDLIIDQPINYKGNGLIVCSRGYIEIQKPIERDDESSTLGIIARLGYIKFNTNKVTAACFSNNAPMCINSKLQIYGNLSCNNFVRDNFVDADVLYDNTVCSVSPLASSRTIGKFEPKRYAVTFADNWSKFTYEKSNE